jgi:hypothetical protein
MAKRKTPKIDLSIGSHKLMPGPIHRIPVVATGTGDRDIDFPDDLAERTVKEARGKAGKIKVGKDAQSSNTPKQDSLLFGSGTGSLWDLIKPAVPKIADADFEALVAGADEIQSRMVKRQFDGLMERIFRRLEDRATWAVDNMGASLKQPFADHLRQVQSLRAQVETALPKVVTELAKRNPGVPTSALIEHALEMLSKQLSPIISVLNVYTDAIEQYQSGQFTPQLRAINSYMEACYRLWTSGDVEGTAPNTPPQLPLSSLTIGARLLSMIGGGGLGTIPGAKGPVGLSLLMYPNDMLDWISLSLTLNSHEGGHQIFADIKGFEPEMQTTVQKAVAAAVAASKLTLSSKVTAVGRSRVPTVGLVVKMITDCIGEIEADVAGVLVNGPAFLYGMLLSFPAMLIREGRVSDAKQLLRTGSVYMTEQQEDGSMKLEFEPHPPDYIRAYLVAAMVEEIGYKADADLLRKMADLMVGKLPDVITWKDAEGNSSDVISIKVADVKAIAPVVAKALIRTQQTSLGAKSLSDLVLWKAKQQTKALALKANLLAGKADIPTDQGSIYPTLVGSAAALAYWEAVHTKAPATVLDALESNVLKMLSALDAAGSK